MDLNQACQILHLNTNYSMEELKYSYRKLALKFHPDKCNDKNGETFKEINSAYIYLSEYKNNSEKIDTNKSYNGILYEFVKYFNPSIDVKVILKIINQIKDQGEKISLLYLKDCDKETCEDIYEFISKYRDLFNIEDSKLDELYNIIREKKNNIIIIKPTLEDLFKANIFKLEYKNEIFYIPLWHSEVHFTLKNSETLIVQCVPDLPKHICIDENNNVNINLTSNTNLQDLLDKKYIKYEIYQNKEILIEISNLYIRKYQHIKFLNKGIPKININKIYDEGDKKTNINIFLELIF